MLSPKMFYVSFWQKKTGITEINMKSLKCHGTNISKMQIKICRNILSYIMTLLFCHLTGTNLNIWIKCKFVFVCALECKKPNGINLGNKINVFIQKNIFWCKYSGTYNFPDTNDWKELIVGRIAKLGIDTTT